MLGMTGLELTAQVLKIKPEMKILLMTAYDVKTSSLYLDNGLPLVRPEDILK